MTHPTSIEAATDNRSSGSGLFSFLKTEVDSFLKGLSGRTEDPTTTTTTTTNNPPRKRHKRSHSEYKTYEKELDSIRQHTHKRLSGQDYTPLTQANLHASTSRRRTDPNYDDSVRVAARTQRDNSHYRSPNKRHRRQSSDVKKSVDALESYYSDEEFVQRAAAEVAAVAQLSSSTSSRKSAASHDPNDYSLEFNLAQTRNKQRRVQAAAVVIKPETQYALTQSLGDLPSSQDLLEGQNEEDDNPSVDEDLEARRRQEARLRASRRKEKEARDARRRQERMEALARLEAREEQERIEEAERERLRLQEETRMRRGPEKQEQKRQKEEQEARQAAREQRRQDRRNGASHSAQMALPESGDSTKSSSGLPKTDAANASADTTSSQSPSSKSTTAAERWRVQELEAEVQRLRKELEAAREQNASVMAMAQAESLKHVHFAPTPPDSQTDGNSQEMSFISITSSTSSSGPPPLAPPPPPPPPPPPVISAPTPHLPNGARPSPLTLVAARKNALKSAPLPSPLSATPTSGKRPPVAGMAMAVDMGKFLSEMKNTKLRKVGLPVEGAKPKPRDEEEGGLKSVLEAALKKRFRNNRPHDRTSDSTATSSLPSSATGTSWRGNPDLSASTSSSITSFSSYRPPDWSMSAELDKAPLPPPRPPRPGHSHLHGNSVSSLPVASHGASVDERNAAKASKSLSQAILPSDREVHAWTMQQHQLKESRKLQQTPARHLHLLSKDHPRPQAAFGHAITTDETAPAAGRKRALPYGHHRQTSSITSLATVTSGHSCAPPPLPTPVSHGKQRGGKTSDGSNKTSVGADQSIRSLASSFDIDIYTQMHLHGEGADDADLPELSLDEIEAERRRSLSDPPRLDGTMDLPSPTLSVRFPSFTSFLGPSNEYRGGISEGKTIFAAAAASTLSADELAPPRLFDPYLPPTRSTSLANSASQRKTSDGMYTRPRPAPAPPLATSSATFRGRNEDALGRPISPAKKSRSPRKLVKAHRRGADEEDETLFRDIHLDEKEARELLDEEDSFLVGYGAR